MAGINFPFFSGPSPGGHEFTAEEEKRMRDARSQQANQAAAQQGMSFNPQQGTNTSAAAAATSKQSGD
jgi:hypothetical protein